MEKVIGVRLKKTGKLAYYNPMGFGFRIGDNVIVLTSKGEEIGRVVKIIDKEQAPQGIEIQNIVKPATKKDIEISKENEKKAEDALIFCKLKAKELNLNMKLLFAEYTFDLSKLTIYFVAEERIDFRELVKLIASEYRARIELRQIGPRDEIKIYPNLGICGKEVCCRTFLEDFESVTIKMAKEQGLQINMSKLSGACGKLMCCLKYEEEAYKENLKLLPKVGDIVTSKKENISGKVINVDILTLNVKVRFGNGKEDERYEKYHVDEIKFEKKKSNVEEENNNNNN